MLLRPARESVASRAAARGGSCAVRPSLLAFVVLGVVAVGCASRTRTPVVDPRYARGRAAALEMRAMLEQYYGGPTVLLETWLGQGADPGVEAGLDRLADKLARAVVWREPFTVGSVGSSVTAAHGNCHDDSYQRQLERIFGPVLAAVGVPFEVRNAGQGGACGDSFRNQIWCLGTLAGPDLDVLHYSWTYFEAGGGAEPFHEMFYRWALLGDRSPVPELVYTDDCAHLSELDRELLARYAPFGADALCMVRGIENHGYPGKAWGVVGDGLHDTTREGELPGTSAVRRDSLGVVFRDWHPGPLLFQTTADALAYRYSEALLRALDRIEADPEPRRRWPRRPDFDRRLLPPPLACDPVFCDAASVPKCLVYGDPVLGQAEVERVTTDDPAELVAAADDRRVDGWEMWRQPSAQSLVPAAERRRPECRHPTACGGLRVPAGTAAGWLRFRLPALEVGFVAVCCAGKHCGGELLAAGAEITVDGRAAAPEVLWGASKCVQVQPRFADGPTPRDVTVGIRLPLSSAPSPAVTHVIGL